MLSCGYSIFPGTGHIGAAVSILRGDNINGVVRFVQVNEILLLHLTVIINQISRVTYGKDLLINMQKLVFGSYLPDFTL